MSSGPDFEPALRRGLTPQERETLTSIMLVILVGFIVLLSIDWRTNPPGIDAFVLLLGILVVGIGLIARKFHRQYGQHCPACGRRSVLPLGATHCPFCGAPLIKQP